MTFGLRGGFALVAALISVVLLGALIVGAFVATSEETRIANGIQLAARGLLVAESAAEGDIAGWALVHCDSLIPGARAAHTTQVEGFQVTTTLVRLNPSMFWLIADTESGGGSGRSTPSSSHRRIGLLLRRVADSSGHGYLLRLEERAWSELF